MIEAIAGKSMPVNSTREMFRGKLKLRGGELDDTVRSNWRSPTARTRCQMFEIPGQPGGRSDGRHDEHWRHVRQSLRSAER